MINLLISTQRTALRRVCLHQMSEQTRKWPDRRAIMVVPEQTKMAMEKDYLTIAEKPGLMLAEILSFRRLAWRLAGEVGKWPAQAVDSAGQAMLIQKILQQYKSDLNVLGELGEKPGFIRQIASVLGDLKRYQINPQYLLELKEKIEDISLRDKTADFGLILQAYDQALSQSGLADAEEDLGLLADILQYICANGFNTWPWQRLSWLRETSIWVNGFGELRDFTPQEEIILHYLSQIAAELNISLAADYLPLSSQAADNGPEMFYIGRKTAWRLHKNMPVARVLQVPDDYSATSEQLAACIKSHRVKLPKETGKVMTDGSDITLVRTPDEDNEISWVAGEIRRLVQEKGFRCRDIAVAACDIEKMAPRLRAIFRQYNLPVFLDQDRALAGTPLMRLVISLLNIGIGGWTRWSVMSYLRSGLTGAVPEQIDELENFLLARGLFREDRLFDDLRFVRAGDSGKKLLALRDKVLLPVRILLGNLHAARPTADKCVLLQEYLRASGILKLIEARSASLAAAGETEAAVNLVKSWNELDRILVQMVQLMAKTAVSFQAFRDQLVAAVESARSGIIPTAVDQISVGDLRRGFLQNPQVLFIIGATADKLPPAWPQEGLLKDLDRQALSAALGSQLPSHGRDRASSDGFLIYSLLTLPGKLLYMTVSGSETSPWYRYLAKLYPDKEILLSDIPAWDDVRLAGPHSAFTYYLAWKARSIFAGKSDLADAENSGWNAVRQILQKNEMPVESAEQMMITGGVNVGEVHLAPQRVQQVYGENIGMSVSQLEQYASCPFLHLAGYLLGLQDRAIWEPEKTETGILLHSTVELAFRELLLDLNSSGTDPEARRDIYHQWLSSDLEARAAVWMQQAVAENNLQRILDPGLRASAGRRARRLATASLRAMLRQYLNEEFLPEHLEWKFGKNSPGQLGLRLDDGTRIELRGKVDRIDQAYAENKVLFRVIDYKSGNRTIDYDAFYHGLSLQLPLYLEAYSRHHPDYSAADAAYFYFDRPMISIDPQDRSESEKIAGKIAGKARLRGLNLKLDELESLKQHSWQKAEELTRHLLAGEFPVSPARLQGKQPPCSWCSYLAVCGFHKQPRNFRWLDPVNRLCGNDFKAQKKQAFLHCLMEENSR